MRISCAMQLARIMLWRKKERKKKGNVGVKRVSQRGNIGETRGGLADTKLHGRMRRFSRKKRFLGIYRDNMLYWCNSHAISKCYLSRRYQIVLPATLLPRYRRIDATCHPVSAVIALNYENQKINNASDKSLERPARYFASYREQQ